MSDTTHDGLEAHALTIDLDATPPSLRTLTVQAWRHRELVRMLARREFFVRYRRASLGVLWAVIMPVLQALVLAFVARRVAGLHSSHNYFLFVFSGQVVWSFFSLTVASASTAIVDNIQLCSRIYFPRILLPLVVAVANCYSSAINVVLLLVLCPLLGAGLGASALLVVPAAALLVVLCAALGATLAAAHVYLRDVRYLVQASLLLMFWLTPVFYSVSNAPHVLRVMLDVNPLSGVIGLFRVATTGDAGPLSVPLLSTAAWIVALLVSTAYLHRRFDRVLADLL